MTAVNPDPFTIRELMWMANGRSRSDWQRMSHLLALLANINRDPKKGKAFKPSDFNPYAQSKSESILITKENVSQMRNAFVGANKK